MKERIDEFAANEKNLIELNEDLQNQLQQLRHNHGTESDETTTITKSIHMEQLNSLTKELELLRRDYADLVVKYQNETQDLQSTIVQLREDIVDLDNTKQLYIGMHRCVGDVLVHLLVSRCVSGEELHRRQAAHEIRTRDQDETRRSPSKS